MKNDCLTAALAVLDEAGIRDREIARGARHPQLRFRINASPALHVFAIPGTASDHRSPQNVRRDLRHYLRDHGVITVDRPEPPPLPAKKPSLAETCMREIETLKRRVQALEDDGG